MVAKDYQKTKVSKKAEVGEIDTSAPFQSVKDAVSLFGEGAFSGEKPSIKKQKPQSAERVLAKETQLHLARRELNKLIDQLKNAETTKSQALTELEKAKRTFEELTQKLKLINESKDSAIRATEAAKDQAKQFSEANDNSQNGSPNMDLETERVNYTSATAELDALKQELRKIRQEYNSSVEAKNRAEKQVLEAEKSAKANAEKVGELSKEIASVLESVRQVKLASVQAKEEEKSVGVDKDKQKQSYKATLEKTAQKLLALKKDIHPELTTDLEAQLSETLSEIEALRKEIENKQAADIDSINTVTVELKGAKESLNKVAEEESSLRSMLETLQLELDKIKKEHTELKEKEVETETTAGNLHLKLQKAKIELEEALMEEAKMKGHSDRLVGSIRQLALESENAKREAQETKQKAEDLRRETGAARIELAEAEKKLKAAFAEAEEAKEAEAKALDRIRVLSEETDAKRASTSETGAHITLSKEEFESLSRKVEESEKLAEMKVAAAIAQVEAVKASENEALKRLEATQKEIEEMKGATQEALKKAEMAEMAKKAVEGELRRWREREEKKAAEAASRILLEAEKSFESSPRNYYQAPKVMETRKLEKAKTSIAKKVLMPSLSSVFHKKKNKVEGGSPSYLPGEKPVW